MLIKKLSSGGHIVGMRYMRTEQVAKQYGPGLPQSKFRMMCSAIPLPASSLISRWKPDGERSSGA